jgi:pseudouridylate synthase
VFATGGIGGVHRDARDSWDESADLETLARTGIVAVCSGVKSILDVGATLERLETLNVTVLGYGTDRFAGFYLTESDYPAPWRADSAAEVATVVRARAGLATDDRAVVVANPLPVDKQLDPALHDRVLTEGLIAAEAAGVRGKDVTPFLLDYLAKETKGASVDANVQLVVRNARLAAEIASELAA